MAGRSLANLASGPRYFQDILDQMDDIGVGSLPIVLMAGFFIGAVMVLQTGSQFTRFGQTALNALFSLGFAVLIWAAVGARLPNATSFNPGMPLLATGSRWNSSA